MNCKLIELDDGKRLLGLIENEDELFLYFKTKNKKYTFSKSAIKLIQDTDIPFENGDSDG